MFSKKCLNHSSDSPCIRDILILAVITLVLGIYLIATTVVISKDGIFYIESARFILDPQFEVLSSRPAGFELLILLAHQTWESVTGELSLQQQVWIAQAVTLACRLLAVIFIYLIGCLCVGRRSGFWGCIILLFLPEPAHWGSDALREWPYLAAMAPGFFCLLRGARRKSPWYLALAGLLGGMGFLIRPESTVLLVLATVVFILMFFQSTGFHKRIRWTGGFVLSIVCFAAPILIYACFSGQITTDYLKHYHEPSQRALNDTDPGNEINQVDATEEAIPTPTITVTAPPKDTATLPGFAYEFMQEMGELTLWFFLPFWGIGIAVLFIKKDDQVVWAMVGTLVLINLGMILFRFWYKQPAISGRWLLPVIALTAWSFHAGIEQAERWLNAKKSKQKTLKWSQILTVIGILICLPKLIEPTGTDKQVYWEAIDWITENTRKNDWFYTHDRRILFYTKRPYHVYDEGVGLVNPLGTHYVVTSAKEHQAAINLPEGSSLVADFSDDKEEILIFRWKEKLDTE